jgi:predicted nuclease of restriction endonuclease-like (RecB) superfamily
MRTLKEEIQRAIDSHTKKSNEAIDIMKVNAMYAIRFDVHITAAYNQEIAKHLTVILESGNLSEEAFLNRMRNYEKRLTNTIRTQEDIIMHSVTVEMLSLMDSYIEQIN